LRQMGGEESNIIAKKGKRLPSWSGVGGKRRNHNLKRKGDRKRKKREIARPVGKEMIP